MKDSNANFGVIVTVATPAVFVAFGVVQVAGLWRQPRPRQQVMRVNKPPRMHGWKTTQLPGPHSGRF